MASSCGCGKPSCSSCGGRIEFEKPVLDWLLAVGGLDTGVDKCGNLTGNCKTALGPLVIALQRLVPGAVTISDYADAVNEFAGLGLVGAFLEMLATATAPQKDQIQAALVGCLVSPLANNVLDVAADGGLYVAPQTAVGIVTLINASPTALGNLAQGLISADAGNTIVEGTDGLLFENDAV